MKALLISLTCVLLLAACTQQVVVTQEPAQQETQTIKEVSSTPVPRAPAREVSGSVRFVDVPSKVVAGDVVLVSWTVNGDGVASAEQTAIYYDTVSHPGIFSSGITPTNAGYASVTQNPAASLQIPKTFSTQFVPQNEGMLFLRAHASLGGKQFWTEERNIVIEPKTSVAENEFVIEADDDGFYPALINIERGQRIKLTFKVRTDNVYYAGLQIKGPSFDTGPIVPGSQRTVSLKPDATFTFTSYWPSSGVKKTDGRVVVS